MGIIYETNESIESLISIIVPVYKVEAYIHRCLKSIISQTYRNLEIILVDDGTPDNSGCICEEYAEKDNRISVYHKENGGLSDARNYGIRKSKGEFITCIDSDDYVDKDYISYLNELVHKYGTKMAICQHRTFYDNGSVVDHGGHGDDILETELCLKRMLYHDVIDTSAWGKLYHRDLFLTVEYPKGKIFEDIGTTYKLISQCKEVAVGYESKYNYIFHNNSLVNGSFNKKKLDMLEMTDVMAEEVLVNYPNLKKAVLRRQVYARFSTLNQMLNEDNYNEERQEIIKFIKISTRSILKDKDAPKRDKLALILLNVNYNLYRIVWESYQRRIMTKA